MKTKILFGAMALLAGSLLAADTAAPKADAPKTEAKADTAAKDAVSAAAKSLGGKANYSWTTTVVVPEGSRFRPGPTTGQTEKDGFTHVSMSFGGNTTEIVLKGDKAAMNTPDNGWQSLAELEADSNGPGRFMGGMARNFKAPAAQAGDLAAGAAEIKKDGDTYSSDLTEDAAKTLLSFRRGGGGDAPTITGAKGSVKFWIKDGTLTKYESHVSGKVSRNGNENEVDHTSTVEIKDVGTTKVTVPEDAMKKMNPPAPAADEKKKT